MSRGPGRVQQAIINAFKANPSAVFGMPQLVAIAFPEAKPEAKHHVAVLRAARRLAEERPDFESHPGRPGIGGRLLVNAADTRSLGIGRVYMHFKGCKTVAECEAFLDDPATEAHPESLPGGFFHVVAERNKLLAGGDDDAAEPLTVIIKARLEEASRQRAAAAAATQEHGASA